MKLMLCHACAWNRVTTEASCPQCGGALSPGVSDDGGFILPNCLNAGAVLALAQQQGALCGLCQTYRERGDTHCGNCGGCLVVPDAVVKGVAHET